jgi:ferredoxin
MAMTGALKNIFGTIPGLRKAEFHLTHPDIEGFSRMIADLNGLVRSRLVVMDAIRAMEGNGPTGGDLVNVGVLILSVDPVASDAVGCRIMGFDPDSIPAITMAEESGLGNARMERIEIRGGRIEDFARRRFRAPAPSPARAVPRFVYRVAKDLAVPKPAIDAAKCTACGECVASCPTEPKSLCMDGRGSRRRGKPATSGGRRGAPSFDYSICIRCYCCQETCPEGAIHLNRAPLARFFSGRPERPGGRHGHHR